MVKAIGVAAALIVGLAAGRSAGGAPVVTNEVQLKLFADYFQFVVLDDDLAALAPIATGWTKQTVADRVVATPRALGLGTARNMTVPVTVRILDAAPTTSAEIDASDHVVEANLDVPSGKLVVTGNEYWPEAKRIPAPARQVVVRVYSRGLGTLSANGLEGKDSYLVEIWPGRVAGTKVLKRWSPK